MIDIVVFVLLAIGAICMIFPLIYMVLSSFMTKNQILSANFSIIPEPWKFGKYAEVFQKGGIPSWYPQHYDGCSTSADWRWIYFISVTFSFSKLNFRKECNIPCITGNDDDSICRCYDSSVRNVYKNRLDK